MAFVSLLPANEETLDRVKAAFEWGPQANLEELFYEVEHKAVKTQFPVYSWDRIDTHPNHSERQIGEAIYEAILELPLAAYKPWLAHPHIMDLHRAAGRRQGQRVLGHPTLCHRQPLSRWVYLHLSLRCLWIEDVSSKCRSLTPFPGLHQSTMEG
jgi:hypothetical protein